MLKYELEQKIEERYNAVDVSLRYLIECAAEISGTLSTIRYLSALKEDIKEENEC